MKKVISILLVICSFLAINTNAEEWIKINKSIHKIWTIKECIVDDVDDWDTINLLCSKELVTNVRLLWINTPDINKTTWKEKCYYNEAKAAMEKLRWRKVNVEFFWNDLCKDSYKWCRNLVRLKDYESGQDINKTLIRKWFAFSWINFDIISKELKEDYIKTEKTAIYNKEWLWNKCKVQYFKTEYNSSIPDKMTE